MVDDLDAEALTNRVSFPLVNKSDMDNKKQDSHKNRKRSRHKKVECPEENCHYIGRRSYIREFHYPKAHPESVCSLSESAFSSQSSKRHVKKTLQNIKV